MEKNNPESDMIDEKGVKKLSLLMLIRVDSLLHVMGILLQGIEIGFYSNQIKLNIFLNLRKIATLS